MIDTKQMEQVESVLQENQKTYGNVGTMIFMKKGPLDNMNSEVPEQNQAKITKTFDKEVTVKDVAKDFVKDNPDKIAIEIDHLDNGQVRIESHIGKEVKIKDKPKK